MRSSTRRVAVLAVALAALLAGCIASTGTEAELSASEGSGDLLLFLSVEEGSLTRADVWWAEDAPEMDVDTDDPMSGLKAIVLKNDVVVAEELLYRTEDRAQLVWNSASSGTTAEAGDTFEVLIVDTADGNTVASYGLEIAP